MIWNWVDYVVLALVLSGALLGWRRGFIRNAVDSATWLGSLALALLLYRPLAQLLSYITGLDEIWTRPVTFTLIFLPAIILVGRTGALMEAKIPAQVHHSAVNRRFGVVPGMFNGAAVGLLAVALFLVMPVSTAVAARNSELGERFVSSTGEVQSALNNVFGEAVSRVITFLVVSSEHVQTYKLPFTDADTPPSPDMEAALLVLVNQERASRGLVPVMLDPAMTAVARQHSSDMFARGYFSHNTPEGLTPFDRLRAGGVRFVIAGENLVLSETVDKAHTALMNSPSHRATMLLPQYSRIGIGIQDGGERGIMVTELFRN